MNLSLIFVIVLAVFAAIAALCAFVVYLEKLFPSDTFDERQKLSRGRAYRLSNFVSYLYFSVVAICLLHQVDGQKRIEPYLLVYFGLMLQLMVDHTYCVMTHSALPLTQKRSTAMISYLISGTSFVTMFFIHQKHFGLSLLGHGTSALLFLMTGCCFFYLVLMHGVQLIQDRKE